MDDAPRPRRTARSLVGSALRRVGLHDLTVRWATVERERAERRRLAHWRAALDAALASPGRPELLAGTITAGSIPVIVCLWSRPDRLEAVLAHLAKQRGCPPIRLILWNNRDELSPRYRAEIAALASTGAVASIEFHGASVNIGGIARFVVADQLRRDGYDGPFITLDDDEEVSELLVSDLLAARVPGGIAGWWAFTSSDDYWDRLPTEPGADATYVGTGGAIFDTSIVSDPAFFADLPDKYGFLEDIWASEWALRHGGRLTKVDTPIEFVQEELNQHHDLIYLKAEFVRVLVTTRP